MPHRYATRRTLVRGRAVAGGGGIVTLDAVGTKLESNGAGPFTDASLIIGTGNALVVGLIIFASSTTTTSFTWNGVETLTQIGTNVIITPDRGLRLYGLLNPTAGNRNLVLTQGAAQRSSFCAMSFNGVNSTFGTAFANFTSLVDNTSTATTISRTVTSSANHYAYALASSTGAATSMTINNTTLCNFTTNLAAAIGYAAASGNVSFTATANVIDNLGIVGVDISP